MATVATGSNPGNSGSNGRYYTVSCKMQHVDHQPTFKCMHMHISKDEPSISDNASFWKTDVFNPNKGTCEMCNFSVCFNGNTAIFKAAILKHINSKEHLKMYAQKRGSTQIQSLDNIVFYNGIEEDYNNQIFMSDGIDCPYGEPTTDDKLKAIFKYISDRDENLSDTGARSFHDSLQTGNSVTEASKKFIFKNTYDENFSCTICDMLILFSPNPNEFRYNLWSHINGDSHKSKLPEDDVMRNRFTMEKDELFKIICPDKDEIRYFEFGPHPYLVKCNLCNIAVSTNINRWRNHIVGQRHTAMHNPVMFKKRPPLSSHIVLGYTELMKQIDTKYKKYTGGIQAGVLPGYVVCVDCCSTILSATFFLKSHLRLESHKRNCLVRPVVPAKITVQNLLRKLPTEARHNAVKHFFLKVPCGLKCEKCRFVCPATTYDMYSHIVGTKH